MSETIGFKEWEPVCEALGSGVQSLLLRKGGIHEGREGFSFKHERFLLFPTRFHKQVEGVRISCDPPAGEWQEGDEVSLRYFCEAVWARTLTDWKQVQSLEGFHIWAEQVVKDRFGWGEEDRIHCALVRVFRLAEPWTITYGRPYGGCRTWVSLPEAPEVLAGRLTPVVPDEEFAVLRGRVEEALD